MTESICLKCEFKQICRTGQTQPRENTVITGCSRFKEKKNITNADRIRAMSDEELANAALNCYECPPIKECPQAKAKYDMPTKDRCVTCWLDWLQQEAE